MAHGPLGEDVADPTLDPTKKTLADPDFTVSDHLRLLASTLYWGAWGGRPGEGEVLSGIDPDLRELPDVQIGASQKSGRRQADISVGYGDRLRYTTGAWKGTGDLSSTDFERISGGIGPGEAFWQRAQQGGLPNQQTDKFGGSLTLGPLRLSGEQQEVTSNPIPLAAREYFQDPTLGERQRIINLEGQYPVGSGILSGRVGREWRDTTLPQTIWEEQQQQIDAPPQTSAEILWRGRPGGVNLEAAARYRSTRGQDPSIDAGFTARIPF
jgi:hypothetical protein